MTPAENTEAEQRSKDPVTRELIERIAEAFDAQELEQLVREDMGESIRNLMAWNEPLHTIVFKLLEKTKGESSQPICFAAF